jgi:UDP-2,3-diacylglucosamine pyrophosphatase LpxH
VDRTTRAIVISDLHIGGQKPWMMSRPERLARFLDGLPGCRVADESLELIIAGDFVDFLAMPPWAGWSPPSQAVEKLGHTMRTEPFGQVFDSLGRLVAKGHRLTILVGNHDVEMTMPPVQDALLRYLQASPDRVRFVDDGRAYRIGGALIEHGNRYDGANINDWSGLRAIASALSRFEEPPDELVVSSGSRLVANAINGIKERYPFVDLLQPEGELTLYLLTALEPSIVASNLHRLGNFWWANRLAHRNRQGTQPGETRYIASYGRQERDEELASAFGDIYERLHRPPSSTPTGALDVLTELVFRSWRKDSLSRIIERGDDIPATRLHRLRVVLRRFVDGDASAAYDGDTAQYGLAAERMIADSQGSIQAVVMGHTHRARHVGDAQRARYINTGTWADIIRVPAGALADGADQELSQFLRDLFADTRPDNAPTYADLRIAADGSVSKACLVEWKG